ncbi:PilZ domain-containing protein, partial [bacterium]|nr:PilZ domain-containing protein [bacterium]
RDISGGGLSLDVVEPLEPGELLALKISFPAFENDVASEVQVLWCRNEGTGYAVGCRFLDPGDLQLKAGLHTLRRPSLPTPIVPAPRRLTRLAV